MDYDYYITHSINFLLKFINNYEYSSWEDIYIDNLYYYNSLMCINIDSGLGVDSNVDSGVDSRSNSICDVCENYKDSLINMDKKISNIDKEKYTYHTQDQDQDQNIDQYTDQYTDQYIVLEDLPETELEIEPETEFIILNYLL